MTVEQEIDRSQSAFSTIVWPHFRGLFGDAQLVEVETATDSQIARILDMHAGVDTFVRIGSRIYPIATRVQFGLKAWKTFTVRSSITSGVATEYQKRKESIACRSLYPMLTVQAYVNGTELLAAAAVSTEHLIERCSELQHQVRTNAADGARFIWVRWDELDPQYTHIIDNCDGESA